MHIKIFLALLTTTLVLLQASPANPPQDKEWIPFERMTDEFNGDQLDLKKWHNRNPSWRGRPPTLFHPDCVTVSNGVLRISAFNSEQSAKRILRSEFTHLSGYIHSRAHLRFGYFEMRAKLMNSSQVSCFWLYNSNREEWSEIDIVEVPAGLPKFKQLLSPNTHYFRGPHYWGSKDDHLTDPSYHKLGFNMADEFHVYGLEWSPTFIRWYVDGKMIRESANKLFFQPLEMSINVEANGSLGALPEDETLPATYEIDYVRSWRQKEFTP